MYQTPAVTIDLAGEGIYFENEIEKRGTMHFTRHITWLEYESQATVTYKNIPHLGIFAGIAYSKIAGEHVFKNAGFHDRKDFNETDPVVALFGAKLLRGRLRLEGEFKLVDIVKSEAKGPQGIFTLEIGMNF